MNNQMFYALNNHVNANPNNLTDTSGIVVTLG